MKRIIMAISYLGLILTIVPSILVLNKVIELQSHFLLMTIGMVLWFATAPLWMKIKPLDKVEEEK